MIILVPMGSFKKKATKWVKYKDFVVADATFRHDSSMSEYGNKVDADELSPTPTLTKIALDPEDKESQIKKRHLNTYLEKWLDDEGFNIKVHFLVSVILKGYLETGEDTNVFVVMTKPMYYAYHKQMIEKINQDYGVTIATGMTHKMEKSQIKDILTRSFPKEHYKTLKKALKRIRKALDIKPEEALVLDDD